MSRYYRFQLKNYQGRIILQTNEEYLAKSEAEAFNLQLVQRLPNMKIGSRNFKNRYKILREITNQMAAAFK